MNKDVEKLRLALDYARERLSEAELKLDMTSINEPELITAAIYEKEAWGKRVNHYYKKLKEVWKYDC